MTELSPLRHRSFLLFGNQFYLKMSLLLCVVAIGAYALTDPFPKHSGGDWLGYVLGMASGALVLWLTGLGLRKRIITAGNWSLKSWTSAHVYLGLSLVVLATLHTGFEFGLNVHTLAFVLMITVIISGMFGTYYYATIPRLMSDNRGQSSGQQMLAEIFAVDVELREAALPLSESEAAFVHRSVEAKNFSAWALRRIRRRWPDCQNSRALLALRNTPLAADGQAPARNKVISLLERKEALLSRTRAHFRYKALLELWLLVHVPMTFALLAALTVHILSVFYFW